MIEIIKRGTKKTCTCNECGCYFSYEDEDVLVESYHSLDIFQMSDDYYKEFVQCPQCDEKVILKQTR
jgi:hypothetical protein